LRHEYEAAADPPDETDERVVRAFSVKGLATRPTQRRLPPKVTSWPALGLDLSALVRLAHA